MEVNICVSWAGVPRAFFFYNSGATPHTFHTEIRTTPKKNFSINFPAKNLNFWIFKFLKFSLNSNFHSKFQISIQVQCSLLYSNFHANFLLKIQIFHRNDSQTHLFYPGDDSYLRWSAFVMFLAVRAYPGRTLDLTTVHTLGVEQEIWPILDVPLYNRVFIIT